MSQQMGELSATAFVCEGCKLRRCGCPDSVIYNWWCSHLKEPSDSACCLCFGILSPFFGEKLIKASAEAFMKENYDSPDFCLYISMPVSYYVRDFIIEIDTDAPQATTASSVRNVLKFIASKEIEKLIGRSHSNQSLLALQINFSHPSELEDCSFLSKLFPNKFSAKKWTGGGKWAKILEKRSSAGTSNEVEQQEMEIDNNGSTVALLTKPETSRKRKADEKTVVYTRIAVEWALNEIRKSSELRRQCLSTDCSLRQLLLRENLPMALFDIEFVCEPLHIGGRYNKYSRYVSQSMWIMEGVRFGSTSIEEVVGNYLAKATNADSYRFTAAGREDIDVRCLGKGRPFAITLTNARIRNITAEEATRWQCEINSATKDIRIRDLGIIQENQLKTLKDGEETKRKTYSALCYVKDGISQEILSQTLAELKDLAINQKTPIRVLHRRPLADRKRIIYSISGLLFDSNHFLLRLSTQAGTYVKEFVHGDFGRTYPSLCDILGVEVDIIELDVESIDMQWPV